MLIWNYISKIEKTLVEIKEGDVLNKKLIITVSLVVVIAVTFFVLDRMKYTTFQEQLLNEISVKDISSIVIDRNSDDAQVKLSDKEFIKEIFEGFSDMELKKVTNPLPIGDYTIRIYTSRSSELGMEFFKDENVIWITKGQKGSDYYKILNDRNYLEAFENENINWEKD